MQSKVGDLERKSLLLENSFVKIGLEYQELICISCVSPLSPGHRSQAQSGGIP